MKLIYKNIRQIIILITMISSLITTFDVQADFGFTMNFEPVTSGNAFSVANIDCRDPYSDVDCVRGISFSDPDKTPFLQEIFLGPDGHYYYHIIVGDLDTEFAQETYIRVIGNYDNVAQCYPSNGLCSWSSGAVINGGYDIMPGGTQADPLDPTRTDDFWRGSGNASANPIRTIFRQIINDGNMFQEVKKLNGDYKPIIDQIITDNIIINPDNSYTVIDPSASGVINRFTVDMSSILISDMSTYGSVTNQLTVYDPTSKLSDFDVTTNSQLDHITGGQYDYTPGSLIGGVVGDYNYLEGDFDPYIIDWHDYLNPANNNIPNY